MLSLLYSCTALNRSIFCFHEILYGIMGVLFSLLQLLTASAAFLRSLKIFSFAGVIGLFVLLPINCAGTQLASFDITVISSEKLDLFTISNVNNGSKW